MNIEQRLKFHINEAFSHIERLESVITPLDKLYPFSEESLKICSIEVKNMLDVLAFRFAKLQDLLGSKIFREYLEYTQFPTEDKNFLDILRELDRENIIDIDKWSEFRAIRNTISHDYPYEESQKADAINYLIKNSKYLVEIVNKIKSKL